MCKKKKKILETHSKINSWNSKGVEVWGYSLQSLLQNALKTKKKKLLSNYFKTKMQKKVRKPVH